MFTATDLMLVINLVFLVPAALLSLSALVIGGVEMTALIRRNLHLQ